MKIGAQSAQRSLFAQPTLHDQQKLGKSVIQTNNQNKCSTLGFGGQIIELKLGQNKVCLMYF